MLRFLLLVSACVLSAAQETSVSDDFGSDKYISDSTTEVMGQTQIEVEKEERDDISITESSENFKIIHKMDKPKAKKSVPLPLIISQRFLVRLDEDYDDELESKEAADPKLNEVLTEEEKYAGNIYKESANKKNCALTLIVHNLLATLIG